MVARNTRVLDDRPNWTDAQRAARDTRWFAERTPQCVDPLVDGNARSDYDDAQVFLLRRRTRYSLIILLLFLLLLLLIFNVVFTSSGTRIRDFFSPKTDGRLHNGAEAISYLNKNYDYSPYNKPRNDRPLGYTIMLSLLLLLIFIRSGLDDNTS